MEGVGEAEFERRRGQHVAGCSASGTSSISRRRPRRDRSRPRSRRPPIAASMRELAIGQRGSAGAASDRRDVHRVAVEPGPGHRRPGCRRRSGGSCWRRPAALLAARQGRARRAGRATSGEMRSKAPSPAERGGEAGIDPLQAGHPLEDRQDVAGERGPRRRRQPCRSGRDVAHQIPHRADRLAHAARSSGGATTTQAGIDLERRPPSAPSASTGPSETSSCQPSLLAKVMARLPS